jgi:hypothetical protein
MDALHLVRNLAVPVVLLAATVGLLAQPRILGRVPLVGGVGESALLGWHRWVGRVAVAGLVVVGLAWSLASTDTVSPRVPGILAHGILCVICAVTILRKAWITQRGTKRRMRQVWPWVTATFALGASFVVLTCAMAAGPWADPGTIGDRGRWLVRQAGTVGHMGLGIALIWLGRLALKTLPLPGGRQG